MKNKNIKPGDKIYMPIYDSVFPDESYVTAETIFDVGDKGIYLKQKAIDAWNGRAEVKSGKWQESFAFGCWHYDCPFCDDGYATKEKDETPPNYCQNCGNKMDGKQMGCVNNG